MTPAKARGSIIKINSTIGGTVATTKDTRARRRQGAAALVLAALALAAGCGRPAGSTSSNDTSDGSTGGTVRVPASDFSHLDPVQGFDGTVAAFYRLVYRGLTTYKAEPGSAAVEVVPDLATDLGTPSDDARTWTFTLRPNVFFQDGRPITSADVKFGVERSFDPDLAIGGPYARQYLGGGKDYRGPYLDKKGLSSIETPDARTVVFNLNQPMGDFANVVAQPVFTPFPSDVTKTSADTSPVSSGPYQVQEYKKGVSLTLARNTHWTRDADSVRPARPDAYAFTFGLDGATQDERMLADQGADQDAVAGLIQPATVARLQAPDVASRVVTGTSGCTRFVAMNTSKAVFSDVRVRQAVNYATDKQAVVAASGGSQLADLARTIIPPGLVGHKDFDLYATPQDAGDPVKAKALLAEAGHPDGITFSLELPNTPVYVSQAEAFQQAQAKAGITVKLNIIDGAKYYESIGTPAQADEAAISGWCPDWASGSVFLPPLFAGSAIVSKGNNNLSQLDDPAVNSQIADIARMTDASQAATASGNLDEQIMQLAPVVPLIHAKDVFVTGSNIDGAYTDTQYGGSLDWVALGLKNTAG